MPSSKAIKTKADSSPANYSNDVKKKLAASNRTGQACDRCRIRKMRCDDLLEGCSPCMQNQSECKTTDRITGRATVRGYVQNLERQLESLRLRNRELEERMATVGINVKPPHEYTDSTAASLIQWNETQGNQDHQAWRNEANSSSNVPPQFPGDGRGPSNELMADNSLFRLPEFRGGLAGNNYLGVSSGNSLLSSIRGTALNVFGMEIDLADYMSSDLDEPDPSNFLTKALYNKSYHAFVQTAFSAIPKLEKLELPPRDEGLIYAQWYFRVINPYLPILHKPTFISLVSTFVFVSRLRSIANCVQLTRVYDDQGQQAFQPSTAETVMVHMVFAIMFFQYAARNWENTSQQSELNELSNRHYHYALGLFPHLVASHTLQDVQALTLICLHLRSFPKPGACWMITTMTVNIAIDLGLHRSVRQWKPTIPKRSALEVEMRKRIFWSILVIHILLSGKLGRPMALRSDDFDVEIPDAVDDDLLSENGLDTSRQGKCGFLVGIEAYKVELIFMDLYSNIYAVKRSPKSYIESVRRLDNRIQQWSEQWPTELLPESASNDEEGRVHAQYLSIWYCEFRLLLRHPSLSLTSSAEFNHENLTVCMEMSQKMLHHVKQVQRYRSLDTNWQNAALYVLAISTTLFGRWERREELTPEIFATLKSDMGSWLSIMGDVGDLLGSGKRLQEAVRATIDKTLMLLSQSLVSKTVPPVQIPSPGPPIPQTIQPNQEVFHPGTWQNPMTAPKSDPSSLVELTQPAHFLNPETIVTTSTPYPEPSGYSYPEPNSTSYSHHPNPGTYTTSASYTTNPTSAPYTPNPPSFPQSTYSNTTPQQTAAAATAYLYSNAPSYPIHAGVGSPSSWRHWAGNVASNLEPQEYLSSASALMQLGRREEAQNGTGPGVNVTDGIVGGDPAVGSGGQPWPLMIFDAGQGAG